MTVRDERFEDWLERVRGTPIDPAILDLLDVIDAARDGDEVADRALRRAALDHLSAGRPMPGPLTAYVMRLLCYGCDALRRAAP